MRTIARRSPYTALRASSPVVPDSAVGEVIGICTVTSKYL